MMVLEEDEGEPTETERDPERGTGLSEGGRAKDAGGRQRKEKAVSPRPVS
jgi:hypothetical protein